MCRSPEGVIPRAGGLGAGEQELANVLIAGQFPAGVLTGAKEKARGEILPDGASRNSLYQTILHLDP